MNRNSKKTLGSVVTVFILLANFGCRKPDYEAMAMDITKEAKTNLVQKLTNALAEGGTKQAIPFCKQNVMAFTSNLGSKKGVLLRRISDKPRNPMNLVTDEEKKIFLEISGNPSKEGEYPVKTVTADHTVTVYVPIPTVGLCLQCHGEPNVDIKKETLDVLQKEYPGDLARGYKVGNLRGLFSVQFTR